jgi:hypothetical protein
MFVAACATPWHFRIDELKPTYVSTVFPGPALQAGYCLSSPRYPPLQYNGSGTLDEAMVGYENFYDPGTAPLACHVYRATLARGQVKFSIENYDSILSAILLFDTLRSVEGPTPQGMISRLPGTSFATRIGMAADESFGPPSFPLIDEVRLGWKSHPVEIDITSYVGQWVSGARMNNGLLLANDLELLPAVADRLPKNSDVQLSWYGNFRLRVLYNVPDNPRTPQQ